MTPTCSLCGGVVQMHGQVVGREITGWQKHRQQGGLNAVIGRKPTGRIACAECMRKLRDGVEIGQGTLL